MKKQKLLIVGIIMNSAGTEKSFLSFAEKLDYERFDVDLMLAYKSGAWLDRVPKRINIIEMPDRALADMFMLTGKNAAATIWSCFGRRNFLYMFEVLPYFVRILFNKKQRADIATRLWCRLLRHFSVYEKEYDVAAAYWGDRTMFYMCDKIKAKKKLAWLHFDYGNPPRDDALYGDYFSRCDAVVTVADKIKESLQKRFPALSDRFVEIENINDSREIWRLALDGETFPDRIYRGKRVLTIGRICEQKGLDMVVDALVKLREDDVEMRWYIIGGGGENEVARLKALAVDKGVADMLILLGPKMNPYPFMRDCDLYVQPSRYEGKPVTVEEAKIMYKPILVTNYLSAAEQTEDGKLGMVVEINADEIYKGVRRMLDDGSLCDEYTRRLSNHGFDNGEEIEKFYALCD